jgi:hypothetical protein
VVQVLDGQLQEHGVEGVAEAGCDADEQPGQPWEGMSARLAQDHDKVDDADHRAKDAVPMRCAGQRRRLGGKQQHQAAEQLLQERRRGEQESRRQPQRGDGDHDPNVDRA